MIPFEKQTEAELIKKFKNQFFECVIFFKKSWRHRVFLQLEESGVTYFSTNLRFQTYVIVVIFVFASYFNPLKFPIKMQLIKDHSERKKCIGTQMPTYGETIWKFQN